jgi:Mg2+-importing ATPase
LNVLLSGIEEGRRTFATTIEVVFMASSANCGNIFNAARTRKPFYRSTPGIYLVLATLGIILVTALIPASPLLHYLRLSRFLPSILVIDMIILAYLLSAETTK